jgi:uncharacterized protein involved in exopolysaccharide biosynthesis
MVESEQMNSDSYLRRWWRRRWLFMVVFLAIAALVIAVGTFVFHVPYKAV